MGALGQRSGEGLGFQAKAPFDGALASSSIVSLPPAPKRVALAWVPPGLLRSPLKSNTPVLRHTPMDDDWLSGATASQISWQQWQRLVPRLPALPRAAANTVGCIGRLIARRARPARGKPQRQTTASAPSCSFTPQRRPTTCPTTPRTTDAAAVTAPDTLANPINVAYRRRLGLIPTNPALCQLTVLTLHAPCHNRHGGSVRPGFSIAASNS